MKPMNFTYTLKIYNGAFDHSMARLIAEWHARGKDIGLDGLMILTYLKAHRYIRTSDAEELLQLDRDQTLSDSRPDERSKAWNSGTKGAHSRGNILSDKGRCQRSDWQGRIFSGEGN